MNYNNILLTKINHFNNKMADSNYSDIRSLYHSLYLSTKYHIRSALKKSGLAMRDYHRNIMPVFNVFLNKLLDHLKRAAPTGIQFKHAIQK